MAIYLDGQRIGTAENPTDPRLPRWHVVLKVRNDPGIIGTIAQGWGNTASDAVEDAVRRSVDDAMSYVGDLTALGERIKAAKFATT
jgi:hypothetical protein